MQEQKKKVALVTFMPHANYGTCLQSYALTRVIEKFGYDVTFLYNGREVPVKSLRVVLKRLVKFILPKRILVICKKKLQVKAKQEEVLSPHILTLPNNILGKFLSQYRIWQKIYELYKCRTIQSKKIWEYTFLDNNYKTRRMWTLKDYYDVVEEMSCFITGSDQIWNPYCGGFNPMMFLEFAGEKKRVAYSSSIVRNEFPIEVRERAKEDLLKFSAIAVREKQSVVMLEELLDRKDITLVVDPVYLLSKEEWISFGNRAKIEFKIPENYIFCYFVGTERNEDYRKMVQDVKKKTGIERVITMGCTTNKENIGQDIFYNDGGPYEFIYLLANADFVCLDSFHGTVFSLKFEIEFAHILKSDEVHSSGLSSQNERINDLVKRYGIKHKIYTNNMDLSWLKPTNFEYVNSIMETEIKQSLNYLEQALLI